MVRIDRYDIADFTLAIFFKLTRRILMAIQAQFRRKWSWKNKIYSGNWICYWHINALDLLTPKLWNIIKPNINIQSLILKIEINTIIIVIHISIALTKRAPLSNGVYFIDDEFWSDVHEVAGHSTPSGLTDPWVISILTRGVVYSYISLLKY